MTVEQVEQKYKVSLKNYNGIWTDGYLIFVNDPDKIPKVKEYIMLREMMSQMKKLNALDKYAEQTKHIDFVQDLIKRVKKSDLEIEVLEDEPTHLIFLDGIDMVEA